MPRPPLITQLNIDEYTGGPPFKGPIKQPLKAGGPLAKWQLLLAFFGGAGAKPV